MNPTKPIFSKWTIEGIPDYVFGSDRELYRLPFATYPNHYGLRKIRKQPGNRYKIGNQWWSQKQLRHKIKLNPDPKVLITPESNTPF